jgi:hypothetical protein
MQHMRSQNSMRTRKRRGGAIIETAFALPIAIGILSLSLFFGWDAINRQRTSASSRYSVWRELRTRESLSEDDLAERCFSGQPEDVSLVVGLGPTDTLDDLLQSVAYHEGAYALADDTVQGRWPRSRHDHVTTRFATTIRMWRPLVFPSGSHTAREGVDWRRDDAGVSYLTTIRDTFLRELHDEVLSLPDATLQQNIRALYEVRW